jgi:hypothetical protein
MDVGNRPPVGNVHPVLRRLHKLLVPRTIVQAIRTQWRRIRRRPLPGSPIDFRSGDTLLLADSSWATRYWHVVDRARKAGTISSIGVMAIMPASGRVRTGAAMAWRRCAARSRRPGWPASQNMATAWKAKRR